MERRQSGEANSAARLRVVIILHLLRGTLTNCVRGTRSRRTRASGSRALPLGFHPLKRLAVLKRAQQLVIAGASFVHAGHNAIDDTKLSERTNAFGRDPFPERIVPSGRAALPTDASRGNP